MLYWVCKLFDKYYLLHIQYNDICKAGLINLVFLSCCVFVWPELCLEVTDTQNTHPSLQPLLLLELGLLLLLVLIVQRNVCLHELGLSLQVSHLYFHGRTCKLALKRV